MDIVFEWKCLILLCVHHRNHALNREEPIEAYEGWEDVKP